MQSQNPHHIRTDYNGCHINTVLQVTNTGQSRSEINNYSQVPNVDELEQVHTDIQTSPHIADGTGSWLLADTARSPEAKFFRKFRDEFDLNNATLLCSGYPLVGKTIIASVVKQHLADLRQSFRGQSTSAVSALYLGHHNMKEASYQKILLDLLKNLAWQCRGSGSHHPAFGRIKTQIIQQEAVTERSVEDCFDEICASIRAFYIVVDGLDEFPWQQRQGLLKALKRLQSQHGPKIKLFVTFRFLQDIKDAFAGYKSFQLHANDDDIARYVEQQVNVKEKLHEWVKKEPVLRSKIVNAVLQAAGNTFFIAKYHMDTLEQQGTLDALRKTITQLPHLTPMEIFRDKVQQIREADSPDSSMGLRILTWVFYLGQSSIPLKRLQYALALSRDTTEVPNEESLLDADDIARYTKDFVVVDRRSGTVSGFHRTAYTYFNDVRWYDFPDAADVIISRCAKHLSFFATHFRGRYLDFLEHPFTKFAITEIRHQIELVERDSIFQGDKAVIVLEKQPALQNISSVFYQSGAATSSRTTLDKIKQVGLSPKLYTQLVNLTQDVFARDFYTRYCPDTRELYGADRSYPVGHDQSYTSLHFAALLGSQILTEILLSDPSLINKVNAYGDTALTIAMKLGCKRVVHVLLKAQASFDLQQPSGWEVLLYTVAQDHHEVAKQALEKAEVAARKKSRRSKKASGVLLLKCVYDNRWNDFADTYKHCKKHPQLKELLNTALLLAVDQQHGNMINKLLGQEEVNININSSDMSGNTALHRAARRNNKHIVQTLISHKADVNVRNAAGQTPWHTICYMRTHEDVCQLLIETGADPNTRDWEGVSSLYNAAAGGHVDSMKLMLEAGTDPGIRTVYGWSPLHWAAGNGHYDATKLLLEWDRSDNRRVDVNVLSDTSETPLDRAIEGNHTAIVELLQEHGALTGKAVCGTPTAPEDEILDRMWRNWLRTLSEEEIQELLEQMRPTTEFPSLENSSVRQERGRPSWQRFFRRSRRPSPQDALAPSTSPSNRTQSSNSSRPWNPDSDTTEPE